MSDWQVTFGVKVTLDSRTVFVTQVAKAEQDRMMLEKVTRDNAARLQQKAVAAEQARLEERR